MHLRNEHQLGVIGSGHEVERHLSIARRHNELVSGRGPASRQMMRWDNHLVTAF